MLLYKLLKAFSTSFQRRSMNTQTRGAKFSNFGLAPIFLAIAFALAVPATHAAPPATGDWSLVWSDEFDCGSTKEAPNPANWGFEYGYVRNSEDQKYTDSLKNAYCQNGLMNIEAHKEQDGTITSASLLSSGKVSHKYGWIEMRGRIDTRLGSWPAFWSLGTEGQWPDSGESDIMEFYTGKLLFNAAWWKTGDGTWDARWDSVAVNVSSLPSGWKDEFHVWAMEWTPDYVKYYMDGVLYNTWDSSQDNNGGGDTSTEGFQHPHYLLLNQAIGGTAGGDASGLAYPTTYEIDYVRWYQNQNPETMIDDSDASITYSGTWGTYVGNGGHMNTEHYSETTGSTATFSFNGTQARYYGFKRNDLGRVNIYVDDVHITTLDLYSSTFLTNQLLFETDVLSSGSHTLKVELTGTQNSSSSGYEAIIDAFSWTDSGDTPPPAQNEIMTWVPPYGDEESRLMAAADFGTCSPKDGLTRVGLQFWEVNSDGTIDYEQRSYLDLNDDDVAWWTAWGQANDIDILLTVHNHDGNSWNWALARSAFVDNRTTLVNSLVTEMERLGLDGVDMDFEGCDGILGTDRADFAQFIQELSGELKARGKILTVDSFRYIWCAPNVNWRPDWLGYIDNIHVMGYEDLYEGSTVNSNGNYYNKYSYHQNKAVDAGYAGNDALMGFPGNFSEWGTSTGYGTDASAHLQEVLNLSHGPTGIAIWDLQLPAADWQTSDLWCEIVALKTKTTTVIPPTPQSPYNGIPQVIPGQIEAEDFDLGDDGLAYHDCDAANQGGAYRASSGVDIEASTEGGYNIGWICANEWLEYTVNVVSAGTYSIEMRVASNTTGGAFHIEFDGVDETGDISVPVTGGWQNWVSITATVNLSAGVQVMRFVNSNSASDEYNINYYSFSASGGNGVPNANFSSSMDSLTATFTDTSTDSDGTIVSWTWDLGDGNTSTVQNPNHTYATDNTYTVTLTVTDNDGVTDSTSQSVTVTAPPPPDTTPPVITLLGDNPVTIETGSSYTDAGATANDNKDGDITSAINTVSTVNTAVAGTYTVTYNVSDTADNSADQVVRTVNVEDPAEPLVIHVGDLNATASGNKRWTATVTVTVHDSSNAAVAGVTVSSTWSDGSSGSCVTDDIGQCSTARVTKELSLTFTVDSLSNGDDSYDDSANIVTSITINKDGGTGDTTPPTITLLGENPVSVTVDSTYDDAGATASDDVDGDLTINIQTNSTVNTDVVGTYTVTYNVSDNAGNTAEEIRTVTVTDPGALAAPTVLSARLSKPKETVALKWNDSNSGEDGFIIERSKDGSAYSVIVTVTDTSYIDDLSGDTGTFSYRVKAYKGADESDYSDSDSILKK